MTVLHTDVTIVGGGPVGLFLAVRLRSRGIHCRILERRTSVSPHSRSIGIHPPSLELFAKCGIVDAFLDQGERIECAEVYDGSRRIGSLSFHRCPGPYRFVLSLPQSATETILEDALRRLDPQCLLRGAEVTGLDPDDQGCLVRSSGGNGAHSIRSKIVVGCDGMNSVVRKCMGVCFQGRAYPDTYVMGDAEDDTGCRSTACIYLAQEGLVESFPLPGLQRRWVLKTDERMDAPSKSWFCDEIRRRTRTVLVADRVGSLHGFGIQAYVASRTVTGRIAIIGDAAHVMSPIGGQGMNVGWMDAWDLAGVLGREVRGIEERNLDRHDRRVRNRAHRAIRRAEWNMRLGRSCRRPGLRNAFVRSILCPPLDRVVARALTMRWI